ncbi:MAG: hypothetical protein CM1200mP40_11770 [Gammaproteobacteria bacterium]|nr:MAG: hypothetical protein CM1200mP40_11770 [Gammaproteobacteria bacterium]
MKTKPTCVVSSYWIPVHPWLIPLGNKQTELWHHARFCLSYFIMRQRDAVGLITFDDEIRNYLPAKCRQPHLMQILRTLAQVESGKKTDVVKPLRDLAASLKKKSFVILISDMLEMKSASLIRCKICVAWAMM